MGRPSSCGLLKAVIAVRMDDSALPCSVLAVALMSTIVRHGP